MARRSASGRPTTTRLTWRLLRDDARPGAENMALDHALATELGHGEAALRLYRWERPTVSFGRNEPARELYTSVRDRPGQVPGRDTPASDVDFVRRPTGGRAVLHDAEVTYTVVAPIRALGGARTAYRAINEALAAALASLGAPVALAEDASVEALDAGPCFQSPAEGEVTLAGRKLVGSAQARLGGALLQHGSIILAGDQTALDALRTDRGQGATASPGAPPGQRPLDRVESSAPAAGVGAPEAPAALRDLLPRIAFDDVADAVAEHMKETFDGAWASGEYRVGEMAAARRLVDERYGTDEWTWRR